MDGRTGRVKNNKKTKHRPELQKIEKVESHDYPISEGIWHIEQDPRRALQKKRYEV